MRSAHIAICFSARCFDLHGASLYAINCVEVTNNSTFSFNLQSKLEIRGPVTSFNVMRWAFDPNLFQILPLIERIQCYWAISQDCLVKLRHKIYPITEWKFYFPSKKPREKNVNSWIWFGISMPICVCFNCSIKPISQCVNIRRHLFSQRRWCSCWGFVWPPVRPRSRLSSLTGSRRLWFIVSL